MEGLTAVERRVYDQLVKSHPAPMSPEELRDALGYPKRVIKPVWDALDEARLRKYVCKAGRGKFKLIALGKRQKSRNPMMAPGPDVQVSQ